MKPLKNVYAQIYDFDNLYQAYLSARKNKRYRDEVLAFTANLEENLITIQNELIYQTYKVGRYREFYVYEPKKRLIMALPFKDRVVQWAVYRIVNPIISRGFIADTYACVEGRGVQRAVNRIKYWMRLIEHRQEKPYYLKLDISKYFYRIDHEVLLNIFKRKFADEQLILLLGTIINSESVAFGLPAGYNPGEARMVYDRGMPIGNLTSQMFANVYLNELDQYIKRSVHAHFYIRYMDDIAILSDSKLQLHEYKKIIEKFLEEELKLQLNQKTAIRPTTLGLDFCGYKIWSTHIKLRKSTTLKMKKRLKSMRVMYENGEVELEKAQETVTSYFGLMKHCDSYRLRKKIADTYILKRKNKEEQHL